MKTHYFIILIVSFLVCSVSKAQTTTTFTINSGLTNTVLAAPMAAGDSVILIKGSYPTGNTVKLTSYIAYTYTPCNILAFGPYATTGWGGEYYVWSTYVSASISIVTWQMKHINLTEFDNLGTAIATFTIMNSAVATGNMDVANQKHLLNIYPNPAQNEFYLELDKKINTPITLNVYNNFGQIVLSETYFQSEERKKIDIEKLNSGIYSLEVICDNERKIQKVIKM
jgi:hypothetical protein